MTGDDGRGIATLYRYAGPATFHVEHAVYRIPHLRLELPPLRSIGNGSGLDRPVVIVAERGELLKARTDTGELRLGDLQEFPAWWTGFRFEL